MNKSGRLSIVSAFTDKMKMLAKTENCPLIQMPDFIIINNEDWDRSHVQGFDLRQPNVRTMSARNWYFHR